MGCEVIMASEHYLDITTNLGGVIRAKNSWGVRFAPAGAGGLGRRSIGPRQNCAEVPRQLQGSHHSSRMISISEN